MKSKILPFILAFSALSISISAAFYSITGLSKLFVGASTEVIVMASALELSKLVAASFLYQYWGRINKILKYYLTSAVFILILITSMGIYGFLSSAYQESNAALQTTNTQTQFYQDKIDMFEQDLKTYNVEYTQIQNTIANLSSAKATAIQVRDTSSTTGFRQTVSTAELRLAQKRIKAEEKNLQQVRQLRNPIRDSIQKYKNKVLEIKQDTSLSSELGPLIYLSELTGKSMDSIINILLLIIIFVFDPLAISLVIAANFAFSKTSNFSSNSSISKDDSIEDLTKDFEDWDTTLNDGLQEEESKEENNTLQDFLDKKRDVKIKNKEQETNKEAPKVINTTNREAEVLYSDGKRRWHKKKDLDTNKIKYM